MNGQQPTPAALKSSPADDPAPASRPPSVPDHELFRRIGSGSYGEVWLARNVLGRWRAVKIIYRSRFQDPRPFEREFEGIQRFEPISRSHPSQLAILHVGKNDDAGCFYYVMELADPVISNQCSVSNKQSSEVTEASGMVPQPKPAPLTTAPLITDPLITDYSPHTLRYDIEQRRRLAIPDCVQIGLSLATALAHLHQHGLVHRDIKPSNVIFVNGVPKLGDIGLVTEAGDTQSIVGTEGYIPPEGPGTPQADLYSLGKVLYEISTGLDRRRFAELPEDLRTWPDRGAVAEFNEIVLKACTKNLARRYPSAQELRADLAVLQRGQSVKRKRTIQRRLAAITRFSLVAGPIALIAVGGGYLRQAVNQNQPAGVGGAIQPEMKGTKNREAWNAYLSGLHYYKRDTQDGSRRAIEYLKEAIRLDPKFAQPYAELAEIYRWSDYLFPSGHEAMTKGKEAALQALALDDSLAQAHKELGQSLPVLAAQPHASFSLLANRTKRSDNFAGRLIWIRTPGGRSSNSVKSMKKQENFRKPSRCSERQQSPMGPNRRKLLGRGPICNVPFRQEEHADIGRRNWNSRMAGRISEGSSTTSRSSTCILGKRIRRSNV